MFSTDISSYPPIDTHAHSRRQALVKWMCTHNHYDKFVDQPIDDPINWPISLEFLIENLFVPLSTIDVGFNTEMGDRDLGGGSWVVAKGVYDATYITMMLWKTIYVSQNMFVTIGQSVGEWKEQSQKNKTYPSIIRCSLRQRRYLLFTGVQKHFVHRSTQTDVTSNKSNNRNENSAYNNSGNRTAEPPPIRSYLADTLGVSERVYEVVFVASKYEMYGW